MPPRESNRHDGEHTGEQGRAVPPTIVAVRMWSGMCRQVEWLWVEQVGPHPNQPYTYTYTYTYSYSYTFGVRVRVPVRVRRARHSHKRCTGKIAANAARTPRATAGSGPPPRK